MKAFSLRNTKEILRDPINFAFGLGFPVVLLLLLTAIQSNVPADIFRLDTLTPGIAVFGFSFISLFSGTLIAKDRSTSFLPRLYASPMSAGGFILGYTLPLLPLALAQSAICFLLSFVLGLRPTAWALLSIASLLPAAAMFIAIGLICGTVFNDKQVGGVCGALLTNLCGWLSGTWFDLKLVGGAFEAAAEVLPFVHAVDAARAALAGDVAGIFPDLWWVIGYAAVLWVLAVFLFGKKMRG